MNARSSTVKGIALSLALCGGAFAQDGVASWADAQVAAAVSDASVKASLDAEYARRFGRFDAAPPPAASGATSSRFEEGLKQARAMLATMKPDDPNREAVLRVITAYEEQVRLAGTPPSSAPARRPACPAPLTLPQALSGARAFLAKAGGDAALARVHGAVTSTKFASGLAATAVLRDRPGVALAALLEAHAREPKAGQHLVNAAGVASMLGLACEALGFLDAAEGLAPSPSMFDARAVRLTTRGHALLTLGRAQDAEAALRQALSLDPLLSEARFNLAMALKAQHKDEEAARFYRLSMRRAPAKGAANPPKQTPEETPSGTDEEPVEHLDVWPPAADVYDLSRGVGWKLPQLSYPKHPREGTAFLERVRALQRVIDDRMRARGQQLADLARRRGARGDASRLDVVISQARVNDIVARIESAEFDPSVKRGWDLVRTELERDDRNVMWNAFRSDAPHTQGKVYYSAITAAGIFDTEWFRIKDLERPELDACKGDNACMRKVKAKHDTTRCDAFVAANAKWRTAVLRLDGAYGEVWDRTFELMTGLAGNISDPLDFQFARLTAEQHADILAGRLLSAAVAPNGFWHRYDVFLVDAAFACGDRAPADALALSAPTSPSCDFKGIYKAKVDFEIAELSFNCEKVALEFTPLQADVLLGEVGVFQEVEFAFEGKMTVTIGVKAGTNAGTVTQGVKGGVYVSVDTSTGQIVDVGVKGSSATGAMTGMVGVEAEVESSLSFIPT